MATNDFTQDLLSKLADEKIEYLLITIQKGIDMVQDGDTVVVTSGTYLENNITFPINKSLTVWGLDGPEATTLTDEWQIVYHEDFEQYAHLFLLQ